MADVGTIIDAITPKAAQKRPFANCLSIDFNPPFCGAPTTSGGLSPPDPPAGISGSCHILVGSARTTTELASATPGGSVFGV
jgi:hypothetical protein